MAVEPLQIWDLGAGVGRDVCFLAEELLRQQQNRHVVDNCQDFMGLVLGEFRL